jgi:ubiquinone/menaquinone biosynthesis C-methylase UbiE
LASTTLVGDSITYDEALWRDYARVYDEVLNVIPYRNLLLELVDAGGIRENMRVLDACCGTGNLLQALEFDHIKCSYTGLDYSKGMLAKAKLKQADYSGSASFVRADLDTPTEKWGVTGPFDRVVFNNCLSFLNDPASILAKSSKFAASGSVLVASMPRPNPNITELLEEHLQLSEELGQSREYALQQMNPHLQPLILCNERLMHRYGDAYHLPNEPQLREWFKDSGWEIENTSSTYAGQNWLVTARKP